MIDPDRIKLLRRGFRIEVALVSWNITEGFVAVVFGALAGSVALLGFGFDSFVETASGVIVGWRLLEELRSRSPERVERIERRTARVAGTLLLILAGYIVIDAGRRLLGFGERAEESMVGIILTALSMMVMPVLGWAKLKIAREINSGALRADAYETITCAWLSFTTLMGLLLNATLGWWWADPTAGLLLVPLIVREGMEGLRGGCGCCETNTNKQNADTHHD
ncbi:MAG: cation diffusion facilitator family transporter [Planctomycetota bacterium]|jgi:divalent metal cation (Fe/Co/Zn/Cd) transporter